MRRGERAEGMNKVVGPCKPPPTPVERLRRDRVEQLKRSQKQRQQWVAQGHGDYMEIADEKQFFAELKKESRAVVHFYRAATRRCEIVDAHLLTLARKHVETRFIKVCMLKESRARDSHCRLRHVDDDPLATVGQRREEPFHLRASQDHGPPDNHADQGRTDGSLNHRL